MHIIGGAEKDVNEGANRDSMLGEGICYPTGEKDIRDGQIM